MENDGLGTFPNYSLTSHVGIYVRFAMLAVLIPVGGDSEKWWMSFGENMLQCGEIVLMLNVQ
jgi:hypothetical protein